MKLGADAAEGSAERLSYEENEAWKRDQCVTDDEVQTITQPTTTNRHDTLSRFDAVKYYVRTRSLVSA